MYHQTLYQFIILVTLQIIHLFYLQVNAPTCPVIVVGTHFDRVDPKKAAILKQLVDTLYGNLSVYPSIAAIACVSSTTVRLKRNSVVNILRKQIYFVAAHLFLDRGKGDLSSVIVINCYMLNRMYLITHI